MKYGTTYKTRIIELSGGRGGGGMLCCADAEPSAAKSAVLSQIATAELLILHLLLILLQID